MPETGKSHKMKGAGSRAKRIGGLLIGAYITTHFLNPTVIKNRAENVFDRLTGKPVAAQVEPGGFFGPSSAWAEKITPQMVQGWFEEREPNEWNYLMAPFGKETPKRKEAYIGIKKGTPSLIFGAIVVKKTSTTPPVPKSTILTENAEKMIIGFPVDISQQLKGVGVEKFSKDAGIISAGTRIKKTKEGNEAKYYVFYVADPGMRGIVGIESRFLSERMGNYDTDVHMFQNLTPITKDFDMIALPNNGCAVATQDALLVVQPDEKGELKMVSITLDGAAKEEGKRPINLQLAYYTVSNGHVYIALKAKNWKRTYMFDANAPGGADMLGSILADAK